MIIGPSFLGKTYLAMKKLKHVFNEDILLYQDHLNNILLFLLMKKELEKAMNMKNMKAVLYFLMISEIITKKTIDPVLDKMATHRCTDVDVQ